MKAQPIYIVMGVSGCGKTTVAKKLAETTGGEWLDADDFHSAQNKSKMSAGHPLTDEDRWPWLDALNRRLREESAQNKRVFLACSALKQAYRDRLTAGVPGAEFIYLKATLQVIRERLAHRTGHFMSASLIDSQFDDLEEPKKALVHDISMPLDQLLIQLHEGAKS